MNKDVDVDLDADTKEMWMQDCRWKDVEADVDVWMCGGYGESVDGFIWLIRVRVFINHRPARQGKNFIFFIFWLCGCIIRTEYPPSHPINHFISIHHLFCIGDRVGVRRCGERRMQTRKHK